MTTSFSYDSVDETDYDQCFDTDAAIKGYLTSIGIQDFWNDARVKAMEGIRKEIAYIGFRPSVTIKEFFSRAGLAKRTDEERAKDLMTLIMVFYERGSNIDALCNSQTMTPQGKQLITDLKTRYVILGTGGKNRAQTAITLPRLTLAFPIQSCLYANMRSESIVPTLAPKCLFVQAFSSLIPLEVPTAELDSLRIVLYAHCEAMRKVSMKIDKKFTNSKADFQAIVNYCIMGRDGSYIKNDARLTMLETLGVTELKEIVKPVRELANDWIASTKPYGFQEMHVSGDETITVKTLTF